MSRESEGLNQPSQESVQRVLKAYEAEDSPEMVCAKAYWRKRLQGEQRIETPLHPDCKITVIVSALGEDVARFAKQITSLKAQRGIKPSEFEVMYVINNGIDDGSVKYLETREKNRQAIEYLRQDHGIVIHVIDKSSPGHAIVGCNLGKARNRGAAEAGVRFYEQKRNGILFQTDADTWFEDPTHLARVREYMGQDEELIAMAGGYVYEWDLDEQSGTDQIQAQKNIELANQLKQFNRLMAFLEGRSDSSDARRLRFSGCHMISRSLETAMVEGLADTSELEDVHFGSAINKFAQGHGMKVANKHTELRLVTALRASDRTEGFFTKVFNRLNQNEELLVPNLLAPETLSEFGQRFRDVFFAAFEKKEAAIIRALFTKKTGAFLLDEVRFAEAMGEMERGKPKKGMELLKALRKMSIGKNPLLEELYDEAYPHVPLTEAYLGQVRSTVLARPGGAAVLAKMDTFYSSIRVKQETK